MTGLAFTDSRVQERMMRIGVEARHVPPDDTDELYRIAVSTLKKKKCNLTPLRTKHDFEALFAKQIENFPNCLYFLTNRDDRLELLMVQSVDELIGTYKVGDMGCGLAIPRLYK